MTHTIITGREELLRKLAQRRAGRGHPVDGAARPCRRPCPAFALAVDLASARAAGWPLPVTWMDVWPAGTRAWHSVWEMPEAIGLVIEPSERMVGEVLLACESPSAAAKVQATLAEFLPEARKVIVARCEATAAQSSRGGLTAVAADAYTLVLQQTRAMLAAAQPQQIGRVGSR